MARMESNGSTLTVKNVPEDVIETLDEQSEDSRSQLVRDILSEYAEQHQDQTSDEYRPSDEQQRAVYDACWAVCNDDLIINKRLHFSAVAEHSQISADNLLSIMRALEGQYVARTPVWPGQNSVLSWKIKPPCADPEKWVRR